MRAFALAMALAQETDGHLTVLNVVEISADAHERLPQLSPGVREYVAAIEEDHRQRLRSAVPDAVRAYCEVETMMVPGKPYAKSFVWLPSSKVTSSSLGFMVEVPRIGCSLARRPSTSCGRLPARF